MPVNPGVEYVKAEEKYRNASTTQEKLLALSEIAWPRRAMRKWLSLRA